MSINLYSIQASEAEKLKDQGIEISVKEEDGQKVVHIEDEDGMTVQYNNIYNKDEIDAYIKAGLKPGEIKNLHQVNIYPTGQIKCFDNSDSFALSTNNAFNL